MNYLVFDWFIICPGLVHSILWTEQSSPHIGTAFSKVIFQKQLALNEIPLSSARKGLIVKTVNIGFSHSVYICFGKSLPIVISISVSQ